MFYGGLSIRPWKYMALLARQLKLKVQQNQSTNFEHHCNMALPFFILIIQTKINLLMKIPSFQLLGIAVDA